MSWISPLRCPRTAIASLWTVDDGGTQALMNAFYTTLQNGAPTKAAALQQAQLALLHGETAQFSPVVDHVSTSIDTYTYPYYWAPFILIGVSF